MDEGINWLIFLYIFNWSDGFCDRFFVNVLLFGFFIVVEFLVFVRWRFEGGNRVLVFFEVIVVFRGIFGELVGGGGVFFIGCNMFDVIGVDVSVL